MSVMSLANSLMLDFRCLIVPRFVYATGDDFSGASISNPKITARLTQLLAETIRITGALTASCADGAIVAMPVCTRTQPSSPVAWASSP